MLFHCRLDGGASVSQFAVRQGNSSFRNILFNPDSGFRFDSLRSIGVLALGSDASERPWILTRTAVVLAVVAHGKSELIGGEGYPFILLVASSQVTIDLRNRAWLPMWQAAAA